MLIRMTILALAVPILVATVAGQQSQPMGSMPSHVASTPVVDGAQHPELIPDAVAYRLYFVTLAKMPIDLQRGQLVQAGLSPGDAGAASKVLVDFKAKWDRLRDGYNNRVEARTADANAQAEFLKARDLLVRTTLTELNKSLTAKAFTALKGHVQHEKRRMKTGVPISGK